METESAQKFVFFLGGQDAEMLEIRNILKSKGLPFFDKKLSWGAKLSEYKEEIESLSEDQVPVFIELKLDCKYPDNAIIIDHHNEMAEEERPSSIEQVAKLLQIKLDRRQKLIAANDRGHIDAMLELCASQDEIDEIRRLDQDAQGATDEDRKLAEKAIKENLVELTPYAAVVDALSDRASPIFDMLYDKYTHIFVRTPKNGLQYTGPGETVQLLKKRYSEMSQKEGSNVEYWWGGDLPKKGYFGASISIREDEIRKMLADYQTENNKVISHHIFMFPFTITDIHIKGEKQVESHSFIAEISEALTNSGWEEAKFRIEDDSLPLETRNLRYSEYFYFHGFARDAIYYTGTEPDEKVVLKVFRKSVGKNAKVIIKLIDGTLYELKLNRIYLHIYESRVGIISVELFNYKYTSIRDVLKINDYGKRVYPQFLGTEDDIAGTKRAFLPDVIQVHTGSDIIEEDFCVTDFRKDRLEVARYIRKLLGDQFFLSGSDTPHNGRFEYRPTIDDRMYVVCWFGSDKWSNILKRKQKNGFYCYETSDMWYRFMYHDAGYLTCQHPVMMKELIKKSTYRRWVEYGTLYGITRYSLTCITNRDGFNYGVIREHMRRHYAHMARLMLAQRASILKFSEDVTKISDDIKEAKVSGQIDQKIRDKVEALHARYIRFVNRMWFTEITPQEQGIEIYSQATEVMRLKQEIEDLKNEIKELYEYVSLSYDRQVNTQVNVLTILGAIFLPLMLIAGVLGINCVFVERGLEKILCFLVKLYHPLGLRPGLSYFWIIPFGISLILFLFLVWLGYRLMQLYLQHMGISKDSEIYQYLTLKGIWKVLRKKPFNNKR